MKKYYRSLVIVIFGLNFLYLACSTQTEAQKNQEKILKNQNQPNKTVNLSQGEKTSPVQETDRSEWKIYKDAKNGYSFRYPPNLILQKKNNAVRLYHFVNFNHQDPCDGRDDLPVQKRLIDFDVTFKVSKKDFQSYKWEEQNRDAEIKLGKANGSAEGKIVTHSYDGCGYDEYIYPFKNARSFIMEYRMIGLFSVINSDLPEAKEALKHPGLLKNEGDIIKQILESFDYNGN